MQTTSQFVGHGVAIPHNGIALGPMAGGAIAADYVTGLVQQTQRLGGRWKSPVGQDDSIKVGQIWLFWSFSST